jgi:exopolysaccharide production protein ExoQ
MLYAAMAPAISTYVLTLDGVQNLGAQGWVGTQSRIGIWHEAARRIAEHPFIGHGFDATRVLSRDTPNIPGTSWPALPLHTHNALLQIWLELGVVGVLLTIALLGTAMRALWPLTARPHHLAVVLATLASTSVIALVSFGVWQHWWLATWMFAGALLHLALRTTLTRA